MPWAIRQAFRRVMTSGILTLDTALIESLDRNEVQELFFQRPKPPYYGKCISSRHFDAIGTGTVQILLEGRYNDCLVANEHFVELKADYSNLDEVLEKQSDSHFCMGLATVALAHVMESHTYGRRIDQLLGVLQ
jgi:hypothetical protein